MDDIKWGSGVLQKLGPPHLLESGRRIISNGNYNYNIPFPAGLRFIVGYSQLQAVTLRQWSFFGFMLHLLSWCFSLWVCPVHIHVWAVITVSRRCQYYGQTLEVTIGHLNYVFFFTSSEYIPGIKKNKWKSRIYF